jgi:hypothetical protein
VNTSSQHFASKVLSYHHDIYVSKMQEGGDLGPSSQGYLDPNFFLLAQRLEVRQVVFMVITEVIEKKLAI